MNLKKLIAGSLAALTLCVGGVMPAFAENATTGQTTFQLSDLEPTYTITVPAEVVVNRTPEVESTVEIVASDVHLPAGKRVAVSIYRVWNENGTTTSNRLYLLLNPKVDSVSTVSLGLRLADGTEVNTNKTVKDQELASFEADGTVPYYVWAKNQCPDKGVCLPTNVTYSYSIVDIETAEAE